MTVATRRARIAVLASGAGSNLQAIVDHFDSLGDSRSADVVLVASDREGAGALERAKRGSVPSALIRTSETPERSDLIALLRDHSIDLVALAGYLRLVETDVVAAYEGRILNVHPALLPAFGGPGMYGAQVHRAVLDSGSTVSGVTVHSIDGEYDRGRIVAQWPVPVLPGDDPASLAKRVLRVEHILFPRVLERSAVAVLRGVDPHPAAAETADSASFVLGSASDAEIASGIDRMLGG